MRQLNLQVSPEFEADLQQLMKKRKLSTKSKAIRLAVREAVTKLQSEDFSFEQYIGAALKAPLNPRPKFKSDDDLW
jgi:hypothetical protein